MVAIDPIADMLTVLRNALAVKKEKVFVPFSKIKFEIAKILQKKGFIEKVEKVKRKIKKGKSKPKPFLEIYLKYNENKTPAISGLERVSRSGQRIYLPYSKIKKIKQGYGIAIISTSKGLMTDEEAKKNKIGGEIICEIW